MSQLAYSIFFVIFVSLAVAVRIVSSNRKRQAVTLWLGYCIGVECIMAATGRDAWPFSAYGALFHRGDASRSFSNLRFVAVDTAGREFEIDPRAWSPLHERTLQQWWLAYFHRLNPDQQKVAVSFLLRQAEDTRRRIESDRRVANSKILGSLAAPFWYEPRSAPTQSPLPYQLIRVYLISRVPAEKVHSRDESRERVGEWGR